MEARPPAVTDLVLQGPAGKFEKDSIAISAALVGSGPPDHHRRRIGYGAIAFVALAAGFFGQGVFNPFLNDPLFSP